MNEIKAGLGRFSGAADRLQVLLERSEYFMTNIVYICGLKISDNGQKWPKMVNFGLVNEVEAGYGRFSGAADRWQVFPERSGYSDTDIGYLRIKNIR